MVPARKGGSCIPDTALREKVKEAEGTHRARAGSRGRSVMTWKKPKTARNGREGGSQAAAGRNREGSGGGGGGREANCKSRGETGSTSQRRSRGTKKKGKSNA